jgi:hypothetical protein
MSAADTIQLVLTRHYRRDNDPQGSAVRLLAQYDADRGGEAYDGELAMLRGLVRTLRVVVRPDASAEKQRAEVRKLLWEHASDDAQARAEDEPGTSDFFQPGHTYAREHHASTIRFLVRYIDTDPAGIYRVAFGWRVEDGDVTWSPSDSDDFTGWVDVTEGGDRRG